MRFSQTHSARQAGVAWKLARLSMALNLLLLLSFCLILGYSFIIEPTYVAADSRAHLYIKKPATSAQIRQIIEASKTADKDFDPYVHLPMDKDGLVIDTESIHNIKMANAEIEKWREEDLRAKEAKKAEKARKEAEARRLEEESLPEGWEFIDDEDDNGSIQKEK